MAQKDDRIKDFLEESREGLELLDRDFVRLESDPGSLETLSQVFRVIHTIKGTCGFFGFSRLEALTHAAEEVLSRVRDGQMPLAPKMLADLLVVVDRVRETLVAIEGTGSDGEKDHAELIRRLETHLPGARPTEAPASASASAREDSPAARAPGAAGSLPASAAAVSASDGTIRVGVGLLDRLMNLVGELVLARNQLLELTSTQRDRPLNLASQRLSAITSLLQQDVMKTRLQRIGTLWGRFPRLVRDLAAACGKRVRLETEGEETELDRSILEAIRDPLVHLLRNAIDHGIEKPHARGAKSAQGLLRLRACHRHGQVRIEIRDDGCGIDLGRVRAKAVEAGLVPPKRAAQMSESELIDLLFLPGFSTAEEVTNVSGRGVGLDVVKTNIERIGGTIEVESWRGLGTQLSIQIPLTLAIVPALLVMSGGQRFAIPQTHLVELVRPRATPGRPAIETVHGALVHRLRGALLPLLDLNQALELGGAPRALHAPPGEGGPTNILVLTAEGQQFGLLVDAIDDSGEIVVKPLGKRLRGLSIFAGTTVLSDGVAALILDVSSLARKTGVLRATVPAVAIEAAPANDAPATPTERLLLLRGHDDSRFAVRLAEVECLEKVSRPQVEHLGRLAVVQYRGRVLPLVDCGGLEGAAALDVVVCRKGGQEAGLVVHGFLDIVEEPLALQPVGSRRGVLGTAVIRGRTTEVLDLEEIVCMAADGEGFVRLEERETVAHA